MGGKKSFELMLEIGYKSQPLKNRLPNGYTHKWTIFVRGANNSKIEHCIQRVVFQLHDSFPDPHREITEPPYQVKETGYAGFEIPIEIYFKNREKPNHVVFTLDLVLLAEAPHSSFRSEKVKFLNPNREFEKCLIKTGAKMLAPTKDKKERSDSPPAKKQKSSSLIPSKDMSKQPPQAQPPQTTTNHSQSSSSHHNHNSSQQQQQQNYHHQPSKSSSQPNHNQNHLNHNHTNSNNSKSTNSSGANLNSNNHFHVSHYNNNNTNTNANNNNNNINNNNNHHHQNNHQSAKLSSQQQSSLSKPKPSKEFIDVFGAPIVFNNNKSHKSSSKDVDNRDVTFTTKDSPTPPIPRISQNTSQPQPQPQPQTPSQPPRQHRRHHHSHHNHHGKSSSESQQHSKSTTQSSSHQPTKPIEPQTQARLSHHHHQQQQQQKQQQQPSPLPPPAAAAAQPQQLQLQSAQSQAFVSHSDPLQVIQAKISSLSDGDRLQKIVDIIEESGEWFNMTPNKFEFDLKRLDKKTLHRIEKCLHL